MNGALKLLLVCWDANLVTLALLAESTANRPYALASSRGWNVPTSSGTIVKRSDRSNSDHVFADTFQKACLVYEAACSAQEVAGNAEKLNKRLLVLLEEADLSEEELERLQSYNGNTWDPFGYAAAQVHITAMLS